MIDTQMLYFDFQLNLNSGGIKWSWGLDACVRWRKITITVAAALNLRVIFKGISDVEINIWLVLGWLRSVAQGYNYSYIKIELGGKFQRNLMSWGIKLNWGLDGCARWRKVRFTVAIQVNGVVIFT